MKRIERPDKAKSQLKMSPPFLAKLMNAKQPKSNCMMTTTRGRPCLSTYANSFGPMPLLARAWMVRVEPKVHELATLMTEMRITALKIPGRTLIPAS